MPVIFNFKFDLLINEIDKRLFSSLQTVELVIPYEKGGDLSFICENGKVEKMDYLNEGTYVKVEVDNKLLNRVEKYIKN